MQKITRKPDIMSIDGLIAQIDGDKTCLPDFQREFVWNEEQCAKLIESCIRNYPIGTVMFLNADVNHKFGARSFRGPHFKPTDPDYFVIDGQQRLNTFYQFLKKPDKFRPLDPIEFYGKNYKLFLNLEKKTEKEIDIDEPTLIIPREIKEIEEEYITDYKKQGKERKIPVEFVLDENYTRKWLDLALGHLKKENINKYQQRIKSIRESIQSYSCFIEIVENKLDPQDHYNIFQLLNSAGTDLTLFDELVAKLNQLGINLRKLWESSKKKYPEIDNYDIDPAYILRIISLIKSTKDQEKGKEDRHSCAKKDLPKLYQKYKYNKGDRDFKNDWEESCNYLEKALKDMKFLYGVVNKKYIPYSPMIITLAAIKWWFEKYRRYDQKYKATMYKKLKRWYWGSVLYNEYDSKTDNKISEHYYGLRKWLERGNKKTPEEVNFPLGGSEILEIFEDIESSADARYKGIICLPLIGMNAEDIFSTEFLVNSKLNDHHIFPRKFLENNGITDRGLVNNLANRTLIVFSTNEYIKKKSPYEYLSGISTKRLKRYFISKTLIKRKIRYKDFLDFLEDRKNKICSYISEYLNS